MRRSLIPGLAAMLACTLANADDMRCGSELVQPGDSVESLLQKCGEPASRNESRWLYKLEDNYRVSVSQDTVSEIETLYD